MTQSPTEVEQHCASCRGGMNQKWFFSEIQWMDIYHWQGGHTHTPTSYRSQSHVLRIPCQWPCIPKYQSFRHRVPETRAPYCLYQLLTAQPGLQLNIHPLLLPHKSITYCYINGQIGARQGEKKCWSIHPWLRGSEYLPQCTYLPSASPCFITSVRQITSIADGTQQDCLERGVSFQSKLLQPGSLAPFLISEAGSFIHSQSTHHPPSFLLGWCFYWRHCWIWASCYPALLLLFKTCPTWRHVSMLHLECSKSSLFIYNQNNAILYKLNIWLWR